MSYTQGWLRTWWDGTSLFLEAWGSGPPSGQNSTTHAGSTVGLNTISPLLRGEKAFTYNQHCSSLILSTRTKVCWFLLGPWKREPRRWQGLFLLPGDGGRGSRVGKVHLLQNRTAVQGDCLKRSRQTNSVFNRYWKRFNVLVMFCLESEWHGWSAESGEQVDNIP